MSRKLSPQQLSPRQPSSLFTNIPEIDTQILLSLPDDSLESACTINKYAASLCDENFWHQRFIQTFGVTLGNYKKPEETYKDIYKKFVKLSLDKQLIEASSRGYLSLVKELLDRGADIHAENDYALRLAAEYGRLDVVKLLLDRGANIKILKQTIPDLSKKLQIKLNNIIEEYETKKKSPITYPIARSIDIDIGMPSMAELREIIRRNDNTIKVGGKGITREYLYNLAKERGWL